MRGAARLLSASIVLLFILTPAATHGQSTTALAPAGRPSLAQAIWDGDLATVKRWLASGGDPLERVEQGPPPFLAPFEVAVVAGNNDALRLLLEKLSAFPQGDDRGGRRLATAAAMNNVVATRELLRRGAAADTPVQAGSGGTALLIASEGGHVDVMDLLIKAGAAVRLQDRQGDSPLMGAIRIGSIEGVKLLLKHGADVGQRDNAGRTPLVWAARTGRADVVRALLDAGASIDVTDKSGQSAMTVAVAKGHDNIVAMLRARGAATSPSRQTLPSARAAIEKSLPLLQRGAATWIERAQCGACHHRPMIDRLTALARQHGFAVDETLAAVRSQRGRGAAANAERPTEPLITSQPAFDLAWVQHHFAEAGVARDAPREAAAGALARLQFPDGRWNPGPPRVPISGSSFVVTASAARVLQAYGPPDQQSEMAAHVERARRWLMANSATETHDEAFRLLGLHWSGADRAVVMRAADALKKEQNADGGWTQLRGMNSDAYITGLVMVALHETGWPVSDPAYQRGVKYLLRTQEQDGSWLVYTRAAPQNPYFESGFPHGKFQFISFAGSCWATMALILAASPP
jgi:ankyrin repeat protein